ncbi:MAG: hypothetical protein JXB05_05625 [Myxococcaceae bacterium]|nr:hypothetical protein [Myxococcaceae bacterium]
MLAKYKQDTNIGVGAGIALHLTGSLIGGMLGSVLVLAGSVAFIWGCINYAKGKGYPGVVGLLGLLSCIGLIILVVLPDKYK